LGKVKHSVAASGGKQHQGEAMSNDLQVEVDRLISIAHVHALNNLAQPEALRELHLDVCRGIWKHYAAAFTASESQRDAFAEALDRATRDLIAGLQQQDNGARTAHAVDVSDAEVPLHAGQPGAVALEGLRPIFSKMVEQ
jgi:hypothetical protein